MCKAKNYTEQLKDIFTNINTELYQQDVLHIIEKGGFNAYEGYKLAKMICDNRQRRRTIKNEIIPLHQLKNDFIDKNEIPLNITYDEILNKDSTLTFATENKIYNPRILKEPELKLIDNNIEQEQMKNKETNMRHKKTKKCIAELKFLEDKLYYAKYEDGTSNIINKKDIQNFDQSKIG